MDGKKLLPGLILALFYALCSIVLHPFDDLPFIDDWTYALSVERLLKVGEFSISDWSAHYPLAQILWGAVFCLPFGFSFSALRISTVVLAWVGALAFYGLVRDLGRPRRESLIATLLLLCHPVFLVLTFSFMTDVSLISFTNIAFLFLTRGVRRAKRIDVWLGALFALCAFLTRQVAVAIPTAFLAYVLLSPYRSKFGYVMPPLASLFLMLSAPFWLNNLFGLTPVYAERLKSIKFWFDVPAMDYVSYASGMLKDVGLGLAPLTLPFLLRYRSKLWIVSLAIFIMEASVWAATGRVILPLEEGSTWALTELGATLPLLGGADALRRGVVLDSFVPAWLKYAGGVLGLLSTGLGILLLMELRRSLKDGVGLLFVLYGVFETGLIFLLWLFYDRYYLVVLPALILLLVSNGLPKRGWTAAGIFFFLLISLFGTWDSLQLNRAVERSFQWLLRSGIPIAEIDAGYPLNGWYLYGHPENLPPGESPDRDVPRVSVEIEKPYVIAVSPLKGYRVLREMRWSPSFWIATNRVYVLKREVKDGRGAGE